MSSTDTSSGKWGRWGRSAFDRSIKLSDWASTYANAASAKIGAERFWPRSNDTEEEILKCERILRSFTVEGIAAKEDKVEEVVDAKGNRIKKKRKVLKKIPPRAIRNAKGIVIYTAMRSGIAPFGGAGGTGLMMARLPDGSGWSAPASVSPNNLAVGLLLGFDVFNVILLLNTQKAVESFYSMAKVTFGAETAIAAGPLGAGTSVESGIDRAPIYSYVQSRGLYAGVEAMGQAFLSRFDENERFYYWPGIKTQDILTGKVRVPPSVAPLHRALRDAETGAAQGEKLERTVYDVVKVPPNEAFERLGGGRKAGPSREKLEHDEQSNDSRRPEEDEDDEEIIHEGERIKLPPTPAELEALEAEGIPDEEDLRLEQKEREEIYKLPPPPIHRKVQTYWDQRPTKRRLRPTHQLVMGGRSLDDPANIPLPPSPWEVPLPLTPSEMGSEEDLFVPLPPLLKSQGSVMPHGGIPDAEQGSARSPQAFVAPPPPRRHDGKGAVIPQIQQPVIQDTPPEGTTTKEDDTRAETQLLPAPVAEDPSAEDALISSTSSLDIHSITPVTAEEDAETMGENMGSLEASAVMEEALRTPDSHLDVNQAIDEPGPANLAPSTIPNADASVPHNQTESADAATSTLSRSSSAHSTKLAPPPRRPPRANRPMHTPTSAAATSLDSKEEAATVHVADRASDERDH